MALRALARVDLGAIERNAARLAAVAAPAALCAVVKADGYGHGMVPAARAAQAGGASWLAVATAEEARGLREAGIEGPVLVMGALSPEELDVALAARADVVAWREASWSGWRRGAGVHVKLDTGMGRLGTRDPAEATRVAEAVAARDDLRLAGAMTHFATADDDPGFMAEQLALFTPWARGAQGRAPRAPDPRRQLRRDAARARRALRPRALRHRRLRHGPVPRRPGRARPRAGALARLLRRRGQDRRARAERGLRPPLRGRRRRRASGTLPIGYGDGVRRGLTNNADVLVGGRRVPLIGTVSMDNVTVDLGDGGAAVGEEAVLIGRQGAERILAEEVARRLDTINYEVTCGISARVPRVYSR